MHERRFTSNGYKFHKKGESYENSNVVCISIGGSDYTMRVICPTGDCQHGHDNGNRGDDQ
jgi:hypothetical protein